MRFKINYILDDTKEINEIDLVSHSGNKHRFKHLESYLSEDFQISGIDPKNNRQVLIDLSTIESISSLGHMSQILTLEGDTYYLNKRLKELVYLESELLCRVNQSTILNLKEVMTFSVGQHSRLEVTTKNGHHYLVSRYYAKHIKERLS